MVKISVNAKSKKHNGIRSTIPFMFIKHTDIQRHGFFKDICIC